MRIFILKVRTSTFLVTLLVLLYRFRGITWMNESLHRVTGIMDRTHSDRF